MTSPCHPVERKDESAWHAGLGWDALTSARPVFWAQDECLSAIDDPALPPGAQAAASARLAWMAPLLARLFPQELGAAAGRVESPLLPVPALQAALGLPADAGALFVKADHALPVAGSVKARGGFHEVLEHAETLAVRHGLLPADPAARAAADPGVLASDAARALFASHQVAVGSTGNLGLAIGIMAAALGFEAVVHMSADAKGWKKERLRRRGVRVVEHAGDYAQAVAAGRAAAAAEPRVHFVDDERSSSLFLGYAVAAERLAGQLAAAGRVVDAGHPLIVYLPCGVGGAPGGIAWGLARTFGEHVHCFFAEPVRSPCFLLQLLALHPAARGTNTVLAALAAAQDEGTPPSVYDIGLDNRTEADGLAVPRASALAGTLAGPRLAGAYTVTDDDLHRLLHHAAVAEGLRLEPSAAAGLAGPGGLTRSAAGRAWLRRTGLAGRLAGATHVAWTTGGQVVPDDEITRFQARGAALAATPPDDPALCVTA
ncbi:D-serine ammonia-lyase [Rubrivivax gelatinosus]|uniref:Probable D-serine dehydratase n=1 Tax=Rubrivivax gelatinosus TaxID=28068 RepID=A0A4R2M710_RUBGE|nr:D-serine ammonia-lyase [Rubrivivax gelatinosus]TCP01891.1 D-serine ammonia-lyase [Rubrivivax gelatinosus]